jgi:hypothetical protein
MSPSLVFAAILALLALLATPAAARTKAAEFLVREQISEACDGMEGRIDPGAAIERDLTGDGKADLIISYEGISCTGGAPWRRSSFCGAQVCPVNIYIRRGALLNLEREIRGAGIEVGDDRIPTIQLHAQGGAPGTLRWNGREFR